MVNTTDGMIFVTTGTQFPFERLVNAIDNWALDKDSIDIYAQTGPGGGIPKHIKGSEMLTPERYESLISKASVLIAHAGIGSIITAIENNIPAILMPRRFDLNEHRNDHQIATAKKFRGYRGLYIVESETELVECLDSIESLEKPNSVGSKASPELLRFISEFIALS
ncbi:glycosyltransferase [Neptuniibacter sp. 2_MG-2023]|uniref:glycosyltransferase n=1 Tax=Neptuniibacter sp. 2_MG-2023 TaxID=3062671 RepID=UPI0026E3A34E|nr:glycosyltransferase [Neptuniibacter sp. 2_MG-2023]MDO6512891.1 glycosyltransferase [Neptuniibacter sp. 2_MG-2023]